MTLLSLFLLLVVTVAFAASAPGPAADCQPATTDLVWRECMDNPAVRISNVSVTPYPLDPSQPPNVVSFTYTIVNGITYDSFLMDLEVSWYGRLITCGWHKNPLPLKNLPGCKIIPTCPMLGDGQPHATHSIDLASVLKVLEALHKNTYHQMTLHIKDMNKVETGCIQAEFMLT